MELGTIDQPKIEGKLEKFIEAFNESKAIGMKIWEDEANTLPILNNSNHCINQ